MARGWKGLAEVIIARAGLAAQAGARARPSTLILAYHNIVPTGEAVAGDASLHLDQSAFADHLDLLLEHSRVVTLTEALEPSSDPSAARVAITFDDAYVGTMTAGVEELARRSLPATVFVPPGLLGCDAFWWDALAPRGGGPLDPKLRDHALNALAGRGDRVLAWARESGIPVHELPPHSRPTTSEDLADDRLPPRVALAAHTWSHPNLAVLDAADAEQELRRSREWLVSRSSRFVDVLSYPYGLRNEAVVSTAQGIFSAAVVIDGGFSERRGARVGTLHTLPRLTIPRDVSNDGLRLRLAGMV